MKLYDPTDEDIAALAKEMFKGNVYSMDMVPEHLIPAVFFPIAVMDPPLLTQLDEGQADNIVIYGTYSEDPNVCAPRFINGYPIFWVVHIWPKDKYALALEKAQAAEQALRPTADSPKTADFFAAKEGKSW